MHWPDGSLPGARPPRRRSVCKSLVSVHSKEPGLAPSCCLALPSEGQGLDCQLLCLAGQLVAAGLLSCLGRKRPVLSLPPSQVLRRLPPACCPPPPEASCGCTHSALPVCWSGLSPAQASEGLCLLLRVKARALPSQAGRPSPASLCGGAPIGPLSSGEVFAHSLGGQPCPQPPLPFLAYHLMYSKFCLFSALCVAGLPSLEGVGTGWGATFVSCSFRASAVCLPGVSRWMGGERRQAAHKRGQQLLLVWTPDSEALVPYVHQRLLTDIPVQILAVRL